MTWDNPMNNEQSSRNWDIEGWGPEHRRLLTQPINLKPLAPKRITKIMTLQTKVLTHITKTGSISIREAMDDYSMSGGSLTKYISNLRMLGHSIIKEFRVHPMTGRRYARYSITGERAVG